MRNRGRRTLRTPQTGSARPTSTAWDRLPEPVRQHFGLIVSFALAAFVALRVFAVAGFSAQTAFTILQVQGTGEILMGTLVPTLALIPTTVSAVCALLYAEKVLDTGAWSQWSLLVVAIVGALFGCIFVRVGAVSAVFSLVAVPVASLILLEDTRRRRDRKVGAKAIGRMLLFVEPLLSIDARRFVQIWCSVVVALAFLVVALSSYPWMPYERLTYGRHHVDGYVLGEQGDRLVVLDAKDHLVVRVPKTAVRRYCRGPDVPDTDNWWNRPLAENFAGTKPEPPCDPQSK